jgi:branched-subunit amino acid transport protein
MGEVWLTIGVLAVATATVRASGPVLLGGRDLPGAVRGVIGLIAPAVLAALVVVQTLSVPEGGAIDIDARILGVAAAGGALALGASTLPVVALAAVVTALARALS